MTRTQERDVNRPDWGVSHRQYAYYHANNIETSCLPPKDAILSAVLTAGLAAALSLTPHLTSYEEVGFLRLIPHHCPSKCQATDEGDLSPRQPSATTS